MNKNFGDTQCKYFQSLFSEKCLKSFNESKQHPQLLKISTNIFHSLEVIDLNFWQKRVFNSKHMPWMFNPVNVWRINPPVEPRLKIIGTTGWENRRKSTESFSIKKSLLKVETCRASQTSIPFRIILSNFNKGPLIHVLRVSSLTLEPFKVITFETFSCRSGKLRDNKSFSSYQFFKLKFSKLKISQSGLSKALLKDVLALFDLPPLIP